MRTQKFCMNIQDVPRESNIEHHSQRGWALNTRELTGAIELCSSDLFGFPMICSQCDDKRSALSDIVIHSSFP